MDMEKVYDRSSLQSEILFFNLLFMGQQPNQADAQTHRKKTKVEALVEQTSASNFFKRSSSGIEHNNLKETISWSLNH